jgi:outer membrane protein assembly factor BamB
VDHVAIITALSAVLLMGADWPRFRGPAATGISQGAAAPVTWTATENVAWKTEMPGAGGSSPVVAGDRVFLTCYSGYGLDKEDPGDQKNLRHHLVCVNRADGSVLWDKVSEADLPEKEYDRGFIYLHGYASGSPAVDDKAVYAFFGRSGVFAYDLDGKLLWHSRVGDGTHHWGSGTSPIVHKDLVIVNASVESQSVVALNKTDGKEVWRVGGIDDSWSTPLLVELADGATELVVSMKNKVLGINPDDGAKLWECDSVRDYVCPSVIAHQGVVFVSGGRSPYTLAIRAGGRGDVSDTHKVWDLRKATKVPTPIYHDGHLYWIDQKGMAVCVDAKTGDVVYQERLRIDGAGDRVYASLVEAGGKLYAVTRSDGTIVFGAGKEFREIARNRLDDESVFNGTPAVLDGTLLIRSDRYLYCIGK